MQMNDVYVIEEVVKAHLRVMGPGPAGATEAAVPAGAPTSSTDWIDATAEVASARATLVQDGSTRTAYLLLMKTQEGWAVTATVCS